MKYDLEELKLYHVYVEFMTYEYKILEKYDNFATLRGDIVRNVNRGLEIIIKLNKEMTPSVKVRLLNDFDAVLKIMKTYARISKKMKIITSRNYSAVCGKISVLNNMMLGMFKSCQKH